MNISDHEGIQWLIKSLGLITPPIQPERFNIAPTLLLDVVALNYDDLQLTPMSWGVSMKTKGKKGQEITRRIPNARDDKVWSSYLWRYLIPEQRVLIPVNGFYEWKRRNKKLVSAYHIAPANGPAMFFAGIYRKSKDGDQIPEVTIITTRANEAMSEVHDRMPVILTSHNAMMAWIQDNDKESLNELMQPASNDTLTFAPVSDYVNKSTNEGERCIEPAE